MGERVRRLQGAIGWSRQKIKESTKEVAELEAKLRELLEEITKVGPLVHKSCFKSKNLKQLEHYFHVLRMERFATINRIRDLRKTQVHHRKLFRQLKLELAHCLLSSESAADDTKQRSKNKDYLDQITQSELNNRKLRRSQEEARVLQLVEKQNQAMLDREEALVRAEEREKAVAAAVQRRKKEQRRTWRKLREIRVRKEKERRDKDEAFTQLLPLS